MDNPFYCDNSGPRFPTLRPKDAAALIVVAKDRGTIRVLMGERNSRHAFLPGRLVFPGGRIDAADQRLNAATDLRPEVLARASAGTSSARARGLGLAAIRETFEETGILVGASGATALRTRSDAWQRFFAHGVIPRLEALDFVARAITPPGRPRRFDARFFMVPADAIARRLPPSAMSGELLHPSWLTLEDARKAQIIPITRHVLDEVEARLMDGPDATRPVPFFMLRRGKPVIASL
jgi:8-oxo-dGTP pyrophosphatase MutT (NUDIX family)